MAKDYFQDISPSDEHRASLRQNPDAYEDDVTDDEANAVRVHVDREPPRGIRSIAPPHRERYRHAGGARDPHHMPMPRGGGKRSLWLWIVAGLGLLVIAILALVAIRPTTVSITPRSHTVVFSNTNSFTAYPADSAPSGALPYTVQVLDLEDSKVVPSTGSMSSSEPTKASGSITVYNNYSASPVTLVKNTRFATPDGLVFRAPSQVVVPGKKGSTPGSVSVTVVADKEGEKYNVGPVDKFTLPGLQSTPSMYTGVYARSTAAMAGGSSGVSGPAVESAVEAQAIAELNAALRSRALESVRSDEGTLALSGLMDITYTRAPNTAESGDQARIHEKAHVRIPIVSSIELGRAIAGAVSADAGEATITVEPKEGFSQSFVGATPELGSSPLQFTLTGRAMLVWQVDAQALAQALAGRDEGAFQTVVSTFPAIEEAHARIEPFWKNAFPTDPSKIRITVSAPKESQ